jgi:hypothetical protein
MTTLTREGVANALLAAIGAPGYFVTTGRRMRDPSAITPAQSPACFVVIEKEDIKREISTPVKRMLTFTAFVYNDVGANLNAFPETALNNAMEALETALKPDDFARNVCTLGGLVQAVLMRGTVHRAPAELTGKALALVPIDVILP